MHVILVVAAVLVVLVFAAGCSKSSDAQSPAPPTITNASDGKRLSPEEIRSRLKSVSESSSPDDLAMGAMCYSVAGPPQRVEYTCPACSQKTLYVQSARSFNDANWFISFELTACRRMVKLIPKLPVQLDESQFCKACSGSDIKKPKLVLVVKHSGRPEHRTAGISVLDLALLRAFAEGQDRYKTSNDSELPLKNQIAHIEKLLGIKL